MFSVIAVYNDSEEYIISQLVCVRNYNIKEAYNIWRESKTYKRFWESPNDYSFVSMARMYQELEFELDGNPFWFKNPF